MIRRKFMQMMTIASVGAFSPLDAMPASAGKTATYFVKGFSCITCATGLDTLLGRQKGVLASTSTYPEGKVSVRFDPGEITDQAIVAFIADLGFTVQSETTGS